jgi:DNA-directed RNA polymerase subunit M/transcription elongation factor TFIIS
LVLFLIMATIIHNSNSNTNTNNNNKHEARNKLVELFKNDLHLSDIEARDLEIGIFNSTIDYANSLKIPLSWSNDLFADTYLNISISIYSNLNNNSYIKNNNLLERLKNRDFLPHKLPYMSCEEMFPEIWQEIMEKHKRKIKSAYEIKQVSMTDAIKCGRCKNNKVTYYELQTRSGDEAMTQYFTCINCGHKWKY